MRRRQKSIIESLFIQLFLCVLDASQMCQAAIAIMTHDSNIHHWQLITRHLFSIMIILLLLNSVALPKISGD